MFGGLAPEQALDDIVKYILSNFALATTYDTSILIALFRLSSPPKPRFVSAGRSDNDTYTNQLPIGLMVLQLQ